MLGNDLPALDPRAEVDDLVQPRSLLLALVRSMTITVPRVFRRISRMPSPEDLKVIEAFASPTPAFAQGARTGILMILTPAAAGSPYIRPGKWLYVRLSRLVVAASAEPAGSK